MDYGPFGEQVTVSTVVQKSYAGLFRDGEAGLDYAEARSYQVRTGRFNAPDPVYAGLFAPQAWNRYGYALNNPLSFVDPTGLVADSCTTTDTWSQDGDNWILNTTLKCKDNNGGGGGGSWADFLSWIHSTWGDSSIYGTSGGTEGYATSGGGGGSGVGGSGCIFSAEVCSKAQKIESELGEVEVSIAGVPSGPAVAAAALAIGARGEQLVKGAFNIGSKVQTLVNGRIRIPDGTLPGRISEIKNVAYQPLTRQLQDYIQIAGSSGAKLDLWVRSTTRLSGPVLDASRAGTIRIIPVLPPR